MSPLPLDARCPSVPYHRTGPGAASGLLSSPRPTLRPHLQRSSRSQSYGSTTRNWRLVRTPRTLAEHNYFSPAGCPARVRRGDQHLQLRHASAATGGCRRGIAREYTSTDAATTSARWRRARCRRSGHRDGRGSGHSPDRRCSRSLRRATCEDQRLRLHDPDESGPGRSRSRTATSSSERCCPVQSVRRPPSAKLYRQAPGCLRDRRHRGPGPGLVGSGWS